MGLGNWRGNDRGGACGFGQFDNRAGGGLFTAEIGHADRSVERGRKGGAGGEASFFAFGEEGCARRGRLRRVVFESDADAIDLATGAHTFDNFLAGVAAFRVADVGVLQAGFVRDLLFAVVVGEPGSAKFEPKSAESLIAGGHAAVFARGLEKDLPERFGVGAVNEELGANCAARGALAEAAGNPLHGDEARFEFGKIGGIDAGEFLGDKRGFRAFYGECGEVGGAVGEGDVIHDDVFVERGDQRFADAGVGEAEEFFGKVVGFDFGEDAALRVEEQRDGAVIFAQVFDVVGEDGVQVADAVGATEVEISAIVFVEEGDAFTELAVLREPIAEVVGKGAAEPSAKLRSGLAVEFGEGREESWGLGFQVRSFVSYQFSKCERWKPKNTVPSASLRASRSALRNSGQACATYRYKRKFIEKWLYCWSWTRHTKWRRRRTRRT